MSTSGAAPASAPSGRTVVALLFGGRSSEHEISCVTAGAVLKAIDRERFAVVPVGITKSGRFVLQPDDPAAFALDPERMPQVREGGQEVLWPRDASSRTLRVVEADGQIRDLARIDVVFPLLHGLWGEDGTIQGLLDLYGLPYVGSGVFSSAACMDKRMTKVLLAAAGIPVTPSIAFDRWQWRDDEVGIRARVDAFSYPVFVKPSRAGSSVGVSRVEAPGELDGALATAFAEDDVVLVEKFQKGREVECGVLGGRGHGSPRASVPGEICVSGHTFYDYEAKYLDESGVEILVPAPLTPVQTESVRNLALQVFTTLDCRGLSRIDFFLTDEGFVVNEVNTMPGFTPVSMFPLVWTHGDFDYSGLVSELIDMALE